MTWTNNGPDTTQSGLHYCNSSRRLQLRSMRTGAGPAENFNTASTLVQTAPMTLDQYGNYARWDTSEAGVVAWPVAVDPVRFPCSGLRSRT